jgi:hypothetical protein
MNFSEYVAILSGNTDLLEKARLEKKVAALESERKTFTQNKAVSIYKLENIVSAMNGNNSLIARAKSDWDNYMSRAVRDSDGTVRNPVQLDGVQGSNPQTVGLKLNEIAKNAYTAGEYTKIGTLYGFNLLVKTETTAKDGLDFRINRFFIEGEGNIKHSYNNGHIAGDPLLASRSFIGALKKIPSLIEKYEKENEKISKDLPVLQEVVNSVWRKENELKDLKTELDALDRKIQLSLKPVEQGEDKTGEKQDGRQQIPVPQESRKLTETEKAVQSLNDLAGGRLSVKDFSQMCREIQTAQPSKEENTSPVTGNVPKYGNQSKGFRL